MTNEEVVRAAHIDREAWEPCHECGPNRLIMGDKYCCECGRPLTEEGWAELEARCKRLDEARERANDAGAVKADVLHG